MSLNRLNSSQRFSTENLLSDAKMHPLGKSRFKSEGSMKAGFLALLISPDFTLPEDRKRLQNYNTIVCFDYRCLRRQSTSVLKFFAFCNKDKPMRQLRLRQ